MDAVKIQWSLLPDSLSASIHSSCGSNSMPPPLVAVFAAGCSANAEGRELGSPNAAQCIAAGLFGVAANEPGCLWGGAALELLSSATTASTTALGGRRVTYGCTEICTPAEFVAQLAQLGTK